MNTLSLGNNNLTGQIPDLSGLTKLNQLYLGNNQLNGPIPATLGNHPYLGELDLRDNQLIGSFSWLQHMITVWPMAFSFHTASKGRTPWNAFGHILC